MRRRAMIFGLGLLAVMPGGGWPAGALEPPLPISTLTIETANGRFPFVVEVAATSEARIRGLQERRSLPADAGMLFDFERPQTVTMWMKNTFIPLDMLFLDDQGRVRRIVRDTVPHSLELIESKGAVRAVLELNAGSAQRIGVREGDRVCHPLLSCAAP